MNFTNEQLTKAKAAKSADELIALAKENGIELTEEEAAKYFAEWHKEGELSDDELANVSGGCGEDPHDAWASGDCSGGMVTDYKCPVCGEEMTWTGSVILSGVNYDVYSCGESGASFNQIKSGPPFSWYWQKV